MARGLSRGAAILAVLVLATTVWAQGPPAGTPNLFSRLAALEGAVADLQDTVTGLEDAVAELQDAVEVIQTSETFAYAARGSSSPTPVPGSPGSPLVSLSLPEGDYVVVGKVLVGTDDYNGITQVACQIHNGGGLGGPSLLDQTGVWLPAKTAEPTPGSFVTLSFTGSVSLEEEFGRPGPATLSIHCATNKPPQAWGQFASLTAVRVTSLIQQ